MSSLDDMKGRVCFSGGDSDGRNVKHKLDSMKASLWNSYQAEWITFKDKRRRCLINPDKLTTDYDQKVISIEFNAGMKAGDVFYWDRTGKWWIVFTPYEQEEAYFRAKIRKCEWQIETDKNRYWIWLRGPVETSLIWKKQIEYSEMNYSLYFYITKNEDTLNFFTRHRRVKFDGHNWKVAAVDKYSQEGIIEVFLEEDFDNLMEDSMREPEPEIKPVAGKPFISGPQYVKPYDTDIVYTVENISGGEFVINSNKVKINETTDTSISLEILTGRSANFEIVYQKDGEDDLTLPVTIKSV